MAPARCKSGANELKAKHEAERKWTARGRNDSNGETTNGLQAGYFNCTSFTPSLPSLISIPSHAFMELIEFSEVKAAVE